MKKEVSTPNADSVPGVLSQAIDTGSLVFVSGQIPITEKGEMIGETVEEKLTQIMKNIQAILKATDLDLDSIVKATVYVTDLAQMPDFNKVYPSYFTAPFPAREAVCVKALPLGATIEISVIASR
jgi:2-iminobutanoate/2-iminopropanoate deaminase